MFPTKTTVAMLAAAAALSGSAVAARLQQNKPAANKTMKANNPDNKKKAKTAKKAAPLKSGIDLAAMDKSVSPRVDFNHYVNGSWLKTTEIPASESRWGAFSVLADASKTTLRKICEKAAETSAPDGSSAQMVGDFWASGMDSVQIQYNGFTGLKNELAQAREVKSGKDAVKLLPTFQLRGIDGLFGVYVDQDMKNSTRYALYAGQASLGLPDKDYYLKQDERSQKIRDEYKAHIRRMMKLINATDFEADSASALILDLETKMAEVSMGRLEMRDPYAIYNKMSFADLKAKSPNLDWDNYFSVLGLDKNQEIIVMQPKYMEGLSDLITKIPGRTWRTYMQWQVIHNYARFLSDPFVNENFNFYGRVLSGTKELQPRWKRVLSVVDASLGEALGQEYVKVAFTPEAKERMVHLVDNLKLALKDRINQLEWMSPQTKKEAQKKLAAITVKIGYPDKWKSYAGLKISRVDYVGNLMRSSEFEFRRNLNKLGKPIDRTEWGMTPPTINAYYNPTMNEIVFPAGILQPPFFDPNADDAVNYGGIGAVIGHELTHGFDDEGRKYDYEGNLKDWWTEEDARKFEARTQLVVEQFNDYIAVDTTRVNGKLTLGENIADLGGLKIAYEAYKMSLKNKKAPVIDGFTGDQRFFIGWAQVWRVKMRNEALLQQVMTDPHSPAMWRINGPLSNLPEFFNAFDVKPGDPMRRESSKQAHIW